jgi:hypothetical protein
MPVLRLLHWAHSLRPTLLSQFILDKDFFQSETSRILLDYGVNVHYYLAIGKCGIG